MVLGERTTVSVPEAAAIIGIARPTLYQAIQRGQFPALRFGRRVMVPASALERFLASVDPQVGNEQEGRAACVAD